MSDTLPNIEPETPPRPHGDPMDLYTAVSRLAGADAEPELAEAVHKARAAGISIFTILMLISKFGDIKKAIEEILKLIR